MVAHVPVALVVDHCAYALGSSEQIHLHLALVVVYVVCLLWSQLFGGMAPLVATQSLSH
jgi:hypothetical protein